jgi:hypothetical protein
MKQRRTALLILIAAHLTLSMVSALTPRTDSRLLAALARYPQPLPARVCAPSHPETGDVEYYPTLYAVIPSMMVLPDTPCDTR